MAVCCSSSPAVRYTLALAALVFSGCGLDRLSGLSGTSGGSTANGGSNGDAGLAEVPLGGTTGDDGGASNASGAAGSTAASGAPGCPGDGTPEPPEEPCTGTACTEPVGMRMMGASGERFGGGGGNLTFDVCLEDEAVIAVVWDTGVSLSRGTDSRVVRLQVVCGKLILQKSGAYTLRSAESRMLLQRGSVDVETDMRAAGRATCPENHAVVGVRGTYGLLTGAIGDYGEAVKELTFICAPLNVTSDSSSYAITIGDRIALDSFGPVVGQALTGESACSAGEVARGLQIRSGRWVDAVGVVCGAPKLTLPLGAPCNDGSACRSGVCSTTCLPAIPCPSCECTCLNYELGQYAFCGRVLAFGPASDECTSKGMHLVHPNTLAESGWIRSGALSLGLTLPLWIGVESLSPNTWQYTKGGGEVPPNLQSRFEDTFWRENEPNNYGGNESCAQIAIEGSWNDVACSSTDAMYVCEK